MPQSHIQAWIKRIPHHIKQVIALEGGNEYKEGRPKERRVDMAINRENLE